MEDLNGIGCDCIPPDVPTRKEDIHTSEVAIHRQKLVARASIDAIYIARAEGAEIDETHELVIAMRAAHGTLHDWRLQRNRAIRRAAYPNTPNSCHPYLRQLNR